MLLKDLRKENNHTWFKIWSLVVLSEVLLMLVTYYATSISSGYLRTVLGGVYATVVIVTVTTFAAAILFAQHIINALIKVNDDSMLDRNATSAIASHYENRITNKKQYLDFLKSFPLARVEKNLITMMRKRHIDGKKNNEKS